MHARITPAAEVPTNNQMNATTRACNSSHASGHQHLSHPAYYAQVYHRQLQCQPPHTCMLLTNDMLVYTRVYYLIVTSHHLMFTFAHLQHVLHLNVDPSLKPSFILDVHRATRSLDSATHFGGLFCLSGPTTKLSRRSLLPTAPHHMHAHIAIHQSNTARRFQFRSCINLPASA